MTLDEREADGTAGSADDSSGPAGWWRETAWPVARGMATSWREDRVTGLAAEIAFFTVLSLVPAALALVAALGSLEFIVGRELASRAEVAILTFLSGVLTERADEMMASVEEVFTEDNTGLVSFATVGALWVLSRAIMGTIRALDVAYGLPHQRSWIKTRFKALLLAIGTIVMISLLLAVVIVGPFLGLGQAIAERVGMPEDAVRIFLLLRFPFAFVMLTAWILMIYRYGPNHHRPWSWERPGAVLAAFLWLVASVGFSIYLDVAGRANQVFGVLGGALTLMVWLYLLGLALLLGAQLNHQVDRLRERPRMPKEVENPSPAPA
ncbi:MAG TPA: YihY/virulence factor BrkB family protein [Actinomycetota bacterium]|nr:YihY/virulence factor BrkB family protein [Actinomycetota bacterium]